MSIPITSVSGTASPLPSPSFSPSGSRFSLNALIQRRPRSNTANGGLGSNPSSPSVAHREDELASAGQAMSSRQRSRTRDDAEGSHTRSQSYTTPMSSPMSNQPFILPTDSAPATPTEQTLDPLSTAAGTSIASPSTPSSNRMLHVRLVPHLEVSSRSLHFEPVNREFRPGGSIKIGRFNDRGPNIAANDLKAPRVAFKSKVVSRSHAEISADREGNFWVKDTKSSSGTFLNHIRLSGPGMDSRLFQVKDGDVLQLGVDYQGGTEEMYRCVKMKVEFNRTFQKAANQFNLNALKQLRALGAAPTSANKANDATTPAAREAESSTTDCCICLFAVTVCQALFIAPCSHVYHFKCIRPLLQMHHPGFSCPLCRTFADLEADVETEEDHFLEDAAREADGSDSDREQAEGEDETTQQPTAETEQADGSPRPQLGSRRSSTQSRRLLATPSEAVPDQYDLRRGSISISGPHGESVLSITGRSSSRPSSVRGFDMSNRTISPMTSTNGLRAEHQSATSMSRAPTAISNEELARPDDFAASVQRDAPEPIDMDSTMAHGEDDTVFVSAQTPANSSFLSSVQSSRE